MHDMLATLSLLSLLAFEANEEKYCIAKKLHMATLIQKEKLEHVLLRSGCCVPSIEAAVCELSHSTVHISVLLANIIGIMNLCFLHFSQIMNFAEKKNLKGINQNLQRPRPSKNVLDTSIQPVCLR